MERDYNYEIREYVRENTNICLDDLYEILEFLDNYRILSEEGIEFKSKLCGDWIKDN